MNDQSRITASTLSPTTLSHKRESCWGFNARIAKSHLNKKSAHNQGAQHKMNRKQVFANVRESMQSEIRNSHQEFHHWSKLATKSLQFSGPKK
jgi:hypothetical protein